MYQVENGNMHINCDLAALCNCIYSKLEDFKNYILELLKNENLQLLEEYSIYYDALCDLLCLFEEFKNEYRALLKTNRIIEYVFRHKRLSPELKTYISDVWKSFSNLLKFKLGILENNNASSEEYDVAYSKFQDELNNHRDYFFSEIYVQTHEFDEEINQMKAILF